MRTVDRVCDFSPVSHEEQRAGEEGCHTGREHSPCESFDGEQWGLFGRFLFSFSFWPGH